MNLQRCINGHFYDADRYSVCPHCTQPDEIFSERKIDNPYNIESYIGVEPYLFISYAHKDIGVFDIMNAFKENNIRFWYDEGIKTGNKWVAEIAERITNCTAFIVFISMNAINSDNVKNELHLASKKNKKIILVHLDNTELDDELELQFGRLQHIYKNKYPNWDDFIVKLLNSIDSRTVGKQTTDNQAYQTLIGRYNIIKKKESSLSTNYLATDTRTNASVFIKHISFNNSYLGNIRNSVVNNEVVLLKLLHQCPYCNHLLDYYEDENNVYIVRNYIDGKNLREVLNQCGSLDIETAMEIASEIAETLCYFYNMTPRVIHKDLKPENIIVPYTGHIYVVDFGISELVGGKDIPSDYQAVNTSMGTVGFAAPEQYRGRTDARTDIYALGVTLFQMLTGIKALNNISYFDVQLYRSEIPKVVADIILKATSENPEMRYQTPMEMLYDLYHYKDISKTFNKFSHLMEKNEAGFPPSVGFTAQIAPPPTSYQCSTPLAPTCFDNSMDDTDVTTVLTVGLLPPDDE